MSLAVAGNRLPSGITESAQAGISMAYKRPPLITPPILTAGQALFLACQQQLHRQLIEVANTDAKAIADIMNFDRKFQQDLA
jgi:hypothetical protein